MTDAPREFKPGGAQEKVPKLEAIVNDVLAAHRIVEDATGTLFVYQKTHWEEFSLSSMRHLVADVEQKALSPSQRADVIDMLRVRVHRRGLAWGNVADHEVPCRSGVLSVQGPKVSMRPHEPDDMLESIVPHDYAPDARCPAWERFLSESFDPGENAPPALVTAAAEKHDTLQEFFGYIVLPHARYKAAAVLYGVKADTGKSIAVKVAQALAGTAACCSLPAEHMDDPQALAVLIGKRLNLMTELPADAIIADGGFKSLVSSEDPIFVNPKYKSPFMYTPRAKHMIATNHLPKVDDTTDTVFRRLLVIPFTNPVPLERQDPGLLAKIAAEMPGIFNWAIEGARRLVRRQGVFTRVAMAEALIDEMRVEANPVAFFVKECLAPQDGDGTPLKQVTTLFNAWHDGRKKSVTAVARGLRSAGYATGQMRLGGRSVKALMGFVEQPVGYKAAANAADGGDL